MSNYEMFYEVRNLKKYDAKRDNKVLRLLYNDYAKNICIENNHEDLIDRFMIEEDRYGFNTSNLKLPQLGKDYISSVLAGEDVVWLISTFWKYLCIHQNLTHIKLVFEYGYNGSDMDDKEFIDIDSLKVTKKEEDLFKKIDKLYENIDKINGYHILVKFNYSVYNYEYDYILEDNKPIVGNLAEVEPNRYGLVINYSDKPFVDLFYHKKCNKIISIESALKNKHILDDEKLLVLCCRYYINISDFDTAQKFLETIRNNTSTENLINQLLLKYNVSDIAFLKSNKNWLDDPLTKMIIKRKSWEAEEIKKNTKKIIG